MIWGAAEAGGRLTGGGELRMGAGCGIISLLTCSHFRHGFFIAGQTESIRANKVRSKRLYCGSVL